MSPKPRAAAPKRAWSVRRKLLLAGIGIVVILGLALGLGLGLGLGRDGDDDDDGSNDTPGPTSSPLPTPNATLLWTPRINDTWQIVLENNIDLADDASAVTPNVSVFDIDLFTTPASTISTLQRLGKKVICYFSAGSYEPGRPDSGAFSDADLGRELDGWPGERWLRLDSENVRGIMEKRVQLAKDKGCDGVDPDNVDGYQNENGLGLTAQDSIAFLSYLSSLTVPLNLTLGLKNAADIIHQVLPIVHFSVNEQCVQESECDAFHAFIDAGKPVFHIEYPDGTGGEQGLKEHVREKYCSGQGSGGGTGGFSTVLKNIDLDGWVEYCDGSVQTTAMNETGADS